MPLPSPAERSALLERFASLREELGSEVIGQEQVVTPVAEWVMQAELGLMDPHKPRGSFLFLGPTGVGKTQLAKSLDRRLSPGVSGPRFDLSEFQTAASVDVFLGRSADDPGRFALELNRAQGSRLVLFDEIDKAYPPLLDLLLQVLAEGRLTTANGSVFDLRQHYVILTCNLGAGAAARMRHNSDAAIERTVIAYARQSLRPELFARVDIVGVFRRLSLGVQEAVCRYHVDRKLADLRRDGIDLQVAEPVYHFLLGSGYSETDGARALERAIHRHFNRALIQYLETNRDPAGKLGLDISADRLCIGVRS